jgi:hypothetical protein
MTLGLNISRCQGRTQPVMGNATLCVQCVDCCRRTDIPTDSDRIVWMEPPKFRSFWMHTYCPMYIGPDEECEVIG